MGKLRRRVMAKATVGLCLNGQREKGGYVLLCSILLDYPYFRILQQYLGVLRRLNVGAVWFQKTMTRRSKDVCRDIWRRIYFTRVAGLSAQMHSAHSLQRCYRRTQFRRKKCSACRWYCTFIAPDAHCSVKKPQAGPNWGLICSKFSLYKEKC